MNLQLFYNFDPTDPSRYHRRTVDAEYFEWLAGILEGTGMTLLFRANVAGRCYYRSQLMSPFDHATVNHRNPDAAIFNRVADMMDACDPLAEAVGAARRHGVPIWIWWNWNEWHNVRPEWIDLNDREWYDMPRRYWCSRDGSRFYCGVPDFGHDQVVQRLVGLAQETLDYGVDGIYLSTRSHSWWPCFPSPGWDDRMEPFGFNDSVVKTYFERHGVDIRYDDYDEDEWLRIKGEQFSNLIARTGAAAHAGGKRFILGVEPDRTNLMVGFANGRSMVADNVRLYKDWERWAAEGSIDGLCAEESCPAELSIEGAEIDTFRETLPGDFPLYTWIDTARWINRDGGPFSLVNWDPHTPEDVVRQIEWGRDAGAAGVFVHTLYHFTAADSDGESIGGYGVLPRTEYLEAIRQANF
ncbi:MAG: hypothetical protein CMJ18_16700 [Phycisphaeraceae bacterium]|nr:hypothetical protein [Phycisphaeraceae bacterium]